MGCLRARQASRQRDRALTLTHWAVSDRAKAEELTRLRCATAAAFFFFFSRARKKLTAPFQVFAFVPATWVTMR